MRLTPCSNYSSNAPTVAGASEEDVFAPAEVGDGVIVGVVHRLGGHALDKIEQIDVVVTRADQGGFSIGEQLHAS